ncbi:hypothetical protein [Pedobacter alpinus]|uniref:Uncharacterized protein n=1 Tax=Pedobacter alpinus TaxID=1590643 RepID=A0ABW5TWE5_9SPHI
MTSPKLADLKKELNYLTAEELKELCLRLAKYKTDNKELLNFMLFYSDKKDIYIDEVKSIIDNEFDNLHPSVYYATKQLRKLIRTINKHIKYINTKNLEVEIAMFFSVAFIAHPIVEIHQKATIGLLYTQLKRILRAIPKLDEDLQFDYQKQLDDLMTLLKKNRPSFSKKELE